MTARKPKGPVTLKDGTVLDDETVDRIVAEVDEAESIARAGGVTVSALAREALEEYVKKAG